jgi:hypothetical protein
MAERIALVVYAFGIVVFLGALGSGPALFLARRVTAPLLLAPAVGLAIAAAALTTAVVIAPLRTVTWVLLVPAALASAIWAGWQLRGRLHSQAREAAIPGVGVVVGLLLAVAPGLVRGTLGPFSIAVFDAWGYVPSAAWLQGHGTHDALVDGAHRYDLSAVVGYQFASSDETRIGADAVLAAVSSLFGVGPDSMLFALLGALFALLPLGVWVLARALGAGRPAAAFGMLFGLSPALLTLVGDSALANLAALVVVPPLLFVGWIGVTHGGRELALAALLGGGLLALFPEFAVPVAAVAGVGVVAIALSRLVGSTSRPPLVPVVWRLALLIAGAVVVAPAAALRAVHYLRHVSGQELVLPDRWLTIENAGAWVFGVLHLYQLPRFELLSPVKMAVAIQFPLLLAAVALVAVLRPPGRQTYFVVTPIAVAIVAGFAAYRRYDHCQYCLWKSLTFMLPFLAVALALGSQRLLERSVVIRLALASVAFCAVILIGNADAKVIQATARSEAFLRPGLRDLKSSVSRLPYGSNVLIEGSDSAIASPFELPAAYYETRGLPKRRVSFDALFPATAYLSPDRPPELYYSPDYTYVVSAFTGVESNRTLLARHGSYALFRRAPIDVVISRTGWSINAAGRSHAIPWITRPFQLRISSRKRQRAALRLRIAHPADSGSTLSFRQAGQGLPVVRSPDGLRVCVDLLLRRGLTVLDVEPLFETPVVLVGRATESDKFPPLPRALGLRGVEAAPGDCPAAKPVPPRISFGPGWFGPESTPQGRQLRWMGTTATLIVGEEGLLRRRARLVAVARSFLVPRRLWIDRNGELVLRRLVPARSGTSIDVTLPAGTGPLVMQLGVDPAARPAASVNPGDPRSLAVAFSDVRVR